MTATPPARSLETRPRAVRWVAPASPQFRGRSRLFCFPFAGGGERIFDAWSGALSPDIEVRAIRLPGRGVRISEPPRSCMAEIVAPIVEEIAALGDLPFALFGHSMGGLVAFEVARTLVRSGIRGPTHLVASAALPPQCREERSHHLLPDAELIQELRNLGGTSEEVLAATDLMEMFLPIIRADFAVCETYRCADRAPLPARIVVFGGSEDTRVPVEKLCRWGEWTTRGCEMQVFDGGHHFLDPCRPAVLNALRVALLSDRARAYDD